MTMRYTNVCFIIIIIIIICNTVEQFKSSLFDEFGNRWLLTAQFLR